MLNSFFQLEQTLAQHLPLLLGRSGGQHGGGQRLLALDEHGLLSLRGGSHHLTRHHLGRRVPGRGRVLEGLLGPHLKQKYSLPCPPVSHSTTHLLSHRDGRHARPGHHHGLGPGLDSHLRPGCGRGRHPGSPGSGRACSGHVHPGHRAGPGNTGGLGRPSRLGSDLGRSEEPLRLRHGGHEVAAHPHLLHPSHLLHPHPRHPLDVLAGQVSLPVLLPLGQGNVQRLRHDDPSVHLGDGLGGLLRGGEADEAEALGAALLAHHLGGGDGAVGSELLPQPLIIDGVVQVLDVEIDSLVSVESLQLQLLEFLLQLGLSLGLLLGSTDVESLATNVGAVQLLHGLLGGLRVLEGDESEALGLATVVGNDLSLLGVEVALVISDLGKKYLLK